MILRPFWESPQVRKFLSCASNGKFAVKPQTFYHENIKVL